MSPHRVYTYTGTSACRRCTKLVLWFRTPSGRYVPVSRCRETEAAAPDGHWLVGDTLNRGQACYSILRYPHQCEGRG
jgi:hypothetical protein